MSLTESEFTALRQTIASRGTARIVLLPVTLIGWSALACSYFLSATSPSPRSFLWPSSSPASRRFTRCTSASSASADTCRSITNRAKTALDGRRRRWRRAGAAWRRRRSSVHRRLRRVSPHQPVIPALLPAPVDVREIGVIARAARGIPGAPRAGTRSRGAPAGCRTRKLSSHQIGTLNRKIVIIGHPFEPAAANSVTNL